jgi:hypothetical protein
MRADWLMLLQVASAMQHTVLRPSRIVSRHSEVQLSIKVGDRVIAANDWNSTSPEYGIIRAQSYVLQRVYYQGVQSSGVARIDVQSLDSPPPNGCGGFTKYIELFSPRYHSEPVIVTTTEVLLTSVKDEIADSAWLALPGFIWVAVAWSIFQYGVDHGFVSQSF